MATAVIKPGLLVGLNTSVRGGITYEHLDRKQTDTEGKEEEWRTRKTVSDPDEQKRAEQVRSKAGSLIRGCCSKTPFGHICPLANEKELDEAIERARALVQAHNAKSVFTKVNINVIKGHIASTDEEAARAIGQNVSDLVAGMNEAIQKLDVKAIREAATKARELEALLSEEQAEVLSAAVKQARDAARVITKRVLGEGEQAEFVLKDIATGKIERARFAFLDLSDDKPVDPQLSLPAVNVSRFEGLVEAEAPTGTEQ